MVGNQVVFNNIEKVIKKLSNNSDRIIMNQKDIEELKEQGLSFEVIPPQTIDQLFEKRKENALFVINKLPSLPQNLPPDIKALYQEIRECIFFGLNGAAITMSSILIEYVLKHTIYIKESGGYVNADPEKWDEFEKMELSPAIYRAQKIGLLDNKMFERLHSFRESIRNPYNHYNIKKITQNVVMKNVIQLNIKTGMVQKNDIAAKDSPRIQAQAKPFVDEHFVLDVFRFADEIVKYLMSQIMNCNT